MGCGDEKLSKSLTQTFTAHCNALICQQVTLSGDAEWPTVADAVIEADFCGPGRGPRPGTRRRPLAGVQPVRGGASRRTTPLRDGASPRRDTPTRLPPRPPAGAAGRPAGPWPRGAP